MLMVGIKRLGYHEFVEAGAVVAGGASRLRRTIRDRIHARDVAHVVTQAESMEHLRAILTDNADVMGLLDLVLCRCSATEGGRGSLDAAHAPTALRVDFPVLDDGHAGNPWVLRAWCDGADPHALPDAVRTVHILADAVREWLVSGPPPRVRPAEAAPRAVTLGNESPAWVTGP
jgi:UDP-GlcNAc:undecaprenyl-phosphate GlcNAc-1-phosphate transferase